MYVSDVASALCHFASGGDGASASSPDRWRIPELCRLIDMAIHTGTADTTKIQVLVNGQPTGDHLRYIQFIDTLAKRAPLNIGWFPPGGDFTAIQRT